MAAVLALACAGCLPVPASSSTLPSNKIWCLYASETRLARFSAGEDMLIWACTLDMAFYKRGGATAEGAYEGRLMLTCETDCYERGLYSAHPAAFEAEGPPQRSYTWTAQTTLMVENGGAAETAKLAKAAAACDQAALKALGMAALPGTDSPQALYDVDDFGDALAVFAFPSSATGSAGGDDPGWQVKPAYLEWAGGFDPPGWPTFCRAAAALAQGVGLEGLYIENPAPAWPASFGAPPRDAGQNALPLWVRIEPNGDALIWLAGFAPLESARPFAGTLLSGGSVAASIPSPPGQGEPVPLDGTFPGEPDAVTGSTGPFDESAADSDMQADDTSAPAGPFDAWLNRLASAAEANAAGTDGSALSSALPDSGTGNAAGDDLELATGEALDPLEQALADHHLPLPPGAIKGPKQQDGQIVYFLEDLTYYDAAAYARKLKMGGYRTVLSETEQPALEIYALVARSLTSRQLALQYKKGKATLSVY